MKEGSGPGGVICGIHTGGRALWDTELCLGEITVGRAL